MKYLFILVVMFSAVVKAQNPVPPPPITPPPVAEEYRWLYELLIPESNRIATPNEAFKSFWVHLLDSNNFFPRPEVIKAENLKISDRVSGTMRFIVVRKKYNYDVTQSADGTLVLNVRIYFKDPVGDDIKNFRQKVQEAENIWNHDKVEMDFKYAFKFAVVEDPSQALYSVSILDDTRGPYDVSWGRNWTSTVIAHELGHMLGLGDEYQTFTSISDCLPESLMCSSWKGRLLPQHFYFILRRFIAQ